MTKFRVWDSDKRIMLGTFDITQDPKYWLDKMVDGDLMQFTGLIDSAGNEVFEKDTVMVIDHGRNVAKAWVGVAKRIKNYFVIESETTERILYHVADNQEIRVFGNVYENGKQEELK